MELTADWLATASDEDLILAYGAKRKEHAEAKFQREAESARHEYLRSRTMLGLEGTQADRKAKAEVDTDVAKLGQSVRELDLQVSQLYAEVEMMQWALKLRYARAGRGAAGPTSPSDEPADTE